MAINIGDDLPFQRSQLLLFLCSQYLVFHMQLRTYIKHCATRNYKYILFTIMCFVNFLISISCYTPFIYLCVLT